VKVAHGDRKDQRGDIAGYSLCWGWLLSRYDFRRIDVLLLLGLNGTLAETIALGPQNLIQVGMCVWVYGLMTYLPACTVPEV
jgi:hypothetical protein